MAKSVFQKKKRIAHFQNVIGNFTQNESENVLSGCYDYVSSIIQNMDSNFNALHSNCSKGHRKSKVTNSSGHNEDSSNNHAISSGKLSPKNPKKHKFRTSRKFPLMEKSQKILKQLKHNRSIPKPRAHLASLPKSPVKANADKASNGNKKKPKVRDARKLKTNSGLCNGRTSDNSIINLHDVNNKDAKISNSKISKNFQKVVCKAGKNTKSTNLYAHSGSEDFYSENITLNANTSTEKNDLNNTNAHKGSENDTSDSEYERFVKESMKGFSNKIIKRKKRCVTKSKASVKKSKSRSQSKNTSKQYDSDKSDCDSLVSLSNRSRKVGAFKVADKVPTENFVSEESEPDIIDAVCTRDSSSESDTSITERTIPLDVKNVCSALHKADSLCDRDSVSGEPLPDVSSCIDKGSVSENCLFIADNVALDASGKIELNNSTPNLVICLSDSDDDCKEAAGNKLPTVSGEYSVTGDTIFYCDSLSKEPPLSVPKEEKFALNNAAKDITHLDSEESDLEIIEIKLNPNWPKSSVCITDKVADVQDSLNSTTKDKENLQAVENYIVSNVDDKHSQVVVKTEILGDVYAKKIMHTDNRNLRADDNKHDAVYKTNICTEFSQEKVVRQKQRTPTNSECCQSSKDDIALKEDVKCENEWDDDIVILDPVQTSTEMPDIVIDSLKHAKYSAHNILKVETESAFQPQNHLGPPTVINVENTNFKNEFSDENLYSLGSRNPMERVSSRIRNTPFTKGDLKLCDVMCSGSKKIPVSGTTYQGNQEFKELEQMNKFHLIELFKKEFQAYQEIVQTEASVGASLKLLETRQAEKVKYIRTLVQKYVGSDQVLGETLDSTMKIKKCTEATLSERKEINTSERLVDDKPSGFFSRVAENPTLKIAQMIAPSSTKEFSGLPPPASLLHQTAGLTSSKTDDVKPNTYGFDEFQNVQWQRQSTVIPKFKAESPREYPSSSKFQSNEKQTLRLLDEKCNVCGKEAIAACQSCAKVFFCSHECGRKFWDEGHINECGK